MFVPTVLPNGRTVLDFYLNYATGNGVVRAMMHKGEWVTWKFYHRNLETTSHGHYTENEQASIADFESRVSEVF